MFVGCDVFGSECRHVADYQPSREANEGGARKRADLLDTRQVGGWSGVARDDET